MQRARTYLSLACVVAVAFGLVAAPSSAVTRTPDRPAAKVCGEWRWSIKTLSDKDAGKVNFKPKNRGVNYLRGLNAPNSVSSDTPRIEKVEFTTYSLKVQILRATFEDDSDIHLVVAAPKNKAHTMIVEFDAPRKVEGAFGRVARDAVDLLGGEERSRIKSCARPGCGALFVDRTRTGSRRWCSMATCGNRVKVATYRGKPATRSGPR